MKGQAAMEFLMTYGWAILAVLISIAALAYFGVLSPARFLPESCTLFPGLACRDFNVYESFALLKVSNGIGESIRLNISMPGCGSGYAVNGLGDSQEKTILIPSCTFTGQKNIRSDLTVIYNSISGSGIRHSRIGKITGEIQPDISITSPAPMKYRFLNFQSVAFVVPGYKTYWNWYL